MVVKQTNCDTIWLLFADPIDIPTCNIITCQTIEK